MQELNKSMQLDKDMRLDKSMQKLMAQVLTDGGECPECGERMLMWKEQEGDNPRCPPVCLSCGHKKLIKAEDDKALNAEMVSRRNKVYNYLRNNSLVRDKSLLRCRLDGYEVTEAEQANAIEVCRRTAVMMAQGQNRVLALAGNVGAGKSHLAMATLYEVIEKSNYKANCLFVDYAAYLNELKFAMDDEETRIAIRKNLNKDIEKADVVVLDDIGSETGGGRDKATAFNIETLKMLLECRRGKSLIYTTNLSGNDVSKLYDERVKSRLFDSSNAEFVTLKHVADYRKKRIA